MLNVISYTSQNAYWWKPDKGLVLKQGHLKLNYQYLFGLGFTMIQFKSEILGAREIEQW